MKPVEVITCYERMTPRELATCNSLGFEAYELHESVAPTPHVMSGFGPRGDMSATWLPPADDQIIRWFVRFSPDSPRYLPMKAT